MQDRPDRERIRPTVEGRARLLAAIAMVGEPHTLDAGALGEFAQLTAAQGRALAEAAMPHVAAHLQGGCPACLDDLRELLDTFGDAAPPSNGGAPTPLAGPGSPSDSASPTGPGAAAPSSGLTTWPPAAPGAAPMDDSGIYAADLPDVRAAEAEAARRQRLRRIRDVLLVAAAVATVLIGLSLIGLAYRASQQPGPARLGLTPLPAIAPAPPGGANRAAPSGMTCPTSHPVKGNRDSMIFHLPGGAFYDQTRPEECFASPADAEAAGYRRSAR